MMDCVLASSNRGKLREFGQLLAPLGWSVKSQAELGIEPAAEPHRTFVENALEKARHAARHSGLAALADDSGLCVPALKGAPGVLSARYAESIGFLAPGLDKDEVNNAALLSELKRLSESSHDANSPAPISFHAYYVCALVFLRSADDPLPLIAQATWHGQIFVDPGRRAGEGGFGYDPYFYLPEFHCTAAQLTEADKNRLSHRAKAMILLAAQLRDFQQFGS